jgi:hypothetical protein
MLETELTSPKPQPRSTPDDLRQRAEALRRRATACADLASDCLTEDAKQVLVAMAEELGQKADALEQTLGQLRATDGSGSDSGAGKTVQG